jgi:DNA-binding response OmpR family regulator
VTLAPAAPPWPAHVIAVAARPLDISRGRPGEFRQRGVLLDGTPNVAAALVEIGRHPESLVLVPTDLGDMPFLDFIEVICAFSDRRVIVGVTPLCDERTVAAALDRGAAASVELPVTPARLSAAVNDARPAPPPRQETLEIGALRLDLAAHRVTWLGREVLLPPKPFAVLSYLMHASPRVVSLSELAGEFGVGGGVTDRGDRIRVSIGQIRSRFARSHPRGLQPLETVHRVGYRINGGGVPVPSRR